MKRSKEVFAQMREQEIEIENECMSYFNKK